MAAITNWFAVVAQDFRHFVCGTRYYLKDIVDWKYYLVAIFSPEFHVVFFFRVYSALYRLRLRFLAMPLYIVVKFLYKCDIYPTANIGAGLLLSHGFDIVIGGGAKLGSDVIVFNGVSIGKKNVGVVGSGMPNIGSGVILGSGSKLLGPIVIGDNATIGANAVVLKDVPAGAVCVGNPGRVLTSEA